MDRPDRDIQLIKQEQMRQGRLKETKDFPAVVLLDTISSCNLRCSMCAHKDMTRKKGIMQWDLFIKLIDEISRENKNARVWMVFFGEALLLKRNKGYNIYQMIKYAKDQGLSDVVLNSNANLLDERTAKNLINSGLDAIYIGIDASREETYAKVRIGGDYHKVVNNVINLINLKKRLEAEKPKVYVQFVEMEENKDEVQPFIDLWKEKGAIVKIRPMVSWAGLVSAPNLTVSMKNRWPCYWAMQTMSIVDDGRVVLCAVDLDARFVAGDINKETLKAVWNNSLKKIRQMHQRGEFDKLPLPCKDCKDWQSAKAEYY